MNNARSFFVGESASSYLGSRYMMHGVGRLLSTDSRSIE